jgi:large conductance mechanosensitive channel
MFRKFFSEFRAFAERGSAIDMAVGVITGAAMGTVVNSLVKDIIMPPIGLLLGDVDMSAIKIPISGTTYIGVGTFANALVSFILTMFAVFIFVRIVNKLRTQQATTTRECPYCKTSISVAAIKCPNCCSAVKPVRVAAPKPGEIDVLFNKLEKIKPLKTIKKNVKKIVK